MNCLYGIRPVLIKELKNQRKWKTITEEKKRPKKGKLQQ